MSSVFIVLTGVILVSLMAFAAYRHRDMIHPAIVIAPLFVWFYCIQPLQLQRNGLLSLRFADSDLEYVTLFFLLGATCLISGTLFPQPRAAAHAAHERISLLSVRLDPNQRRRLLYAGILLGAVAFGAYWSTLESVGGFVAAFSRAKGGGYASSGYIGEAVLFSFPALLMIALSTQSQGSISLGQVVLALAVVSPSLMQGTFGGRRGPLFLSLAVLFLAWIVRRGRAPKLHVVISGIALIGVAVAFVQSQRQYVYLGSTERISLARFAEMLSQEREAIVDDRAGNEYEVAVGAILTADYHENFYWGRRFFVTYFIRPIPRQLWPEKYEAFGFSSRGGSYSSASMGDPFFEAVGFTPLTGSSIGSLADTYSEFSWGSLPFLLIVGLLMGAAWRWHRESGGLGTIILAVMLISSIYLPSQSLSAWGHRVLIMSTVSTIVWRVWLKLPTSARRSQ